MNNSHPERKIPLSEQPTGDDRNLLNFIASTVEMILDRMATKDDLARVEARLDLKIDGVEARLGSRIDGLETRIDGLDAKIDRVEARLSEKIDVEITAVRGDIEQVHLRLGNIERDLTSKLAHVEADVSRLRSVVYLLVKEDPHLLRMLGYAPPYGG